MDLTVKLPDDVLCHVLNNVSSILEQFRMAAVNGKFRRCMFKVMKKPQPLEVDFTENHLCGHQLAVVKWVAAVEVLAKEARFNRITILSVETLPQEIQELLSNILNALATNADCLSQVTEITVRLSAFGNFNDFTANYLASTMSKCRKLSVLELDFVQCPVPVPTSVLSPHFHFYSLDLTPALKDKPISQLHLKLAEYKDHESIGLIQSLKPNNLRKLNVFLLCSWVAEPAVLLRELCVSAAECLEVVQIHGMSCAPPNDSFACIPQLPALRSLSTNSNDGFNLPEQFNTSLKLFLSNNEQATPIVVQLGDTSLDKLANCQLLTRIRQLQREIPQLVFGYDLNMKRMKLRLGHVAIGLHKLDRRCADRHCHQCNSCYRTTIDSLVAKARTELGGHLGNVWLNRCTIGHVVAKLNSKRGSSHKWSALDAVENQTQDQATITFQDRNEAEFEITVNTNRCFDSSCTQCLVI